MSDNNTAIHYVCTYEDGKALLAEQQEFYLRTCGCRARHPEHHTDNNRCLWFTEQHLDEWEGGSEPISAEAAAACLDRAREEGLVIRPFRDFDTRSKTIGICFCCTCCCSYFNDSPQEGCDKGAFIEQTDAQQCNNCGLCIDACHFGARELVCGELQIDHDHCYGCGICTDVCPVGAIGMVKR